MIPVLQAIVLAERIYEDKSGRKIIAGTFNGITLARTNLGHREDGQEGPLQVPSGSGSIAPWVYVSLTDVCDNTTVEIQFISLSKNHTILGMQMLINTQDRLGTVELVLPLPDLARFIHDEGVYAVQVVCKDEILGTHRVKVTQIENH